MQRNILDKIVQNEKLFEHFKEQSYWIKYLNRSPSYFKDFEKEMKVVYKERPSDKINNVVDTVELVTSIFGTL